MPAANFKITLEQGVDYNKSLVVKDALGSPLNLTGYSCRMQVRKYHFSDTVILEASSSNGKISIDPLVGVILINLSSADTESFNTLSAVYDMEIIAPSGKVTRILQGEVSCSPGVTRSV